VEKIGGSTLRLGTEADPMQPDANEAKKKSSSGVAKGMQSSNNAYMFVYTEQSTAEHIRHLEAAKATAKDEFRSKAQGETEKEKAPPEETEKGARKRKNKGKSKSRSKASGDKTDGWEWDGNVVWPTDFPGYLKEYIKNDWETLDEEVRTFEEHKVGTVDCDKYACWYLPANLSLSRLNKVSRIRRSTKNCDCSAD
jgi:hypothetical protein